MQMLLLASALVLALALALATQLTISCLMRSHSVTAESSSVCGRKECIADTCIALITHHINLGLFVFIPGGSHTQQLRCPLPLRSLQGPGVFTLNNYVPGTLHALPLSITFLVCGSHCTHHYLEWLLLFMCVCVYHIFLNYNENITKETISSLIHHIVFKA